MGRGGEVFGKKKISSSVLSKEARKEIEKAEINQTKGGVCSVYESLCGNEACECHADRHLEKARHHEQGVQ